MAPWPMPRPAPALAGGQSLVPMLNLRLVLVDLVVISAQSPS